MAAARLGEVVAEGAEVCATEAQAPKKEGTAAQVGRPSRRCGARTENLIFGRQKAICGRKRAAFPTRKPGLHLCSLSGSPTRWCYGHLDAFAAARPRTVNHRPSSTRGRNPNCPRHRRLNRAAEAHRQGRTTAPSKETTQALRPALAVCQVAGVSRSRKPFRGSRSQLNSRCSSSPGLDAGARS